MYYSIRGNVNNPEGQQEVIDILNKYQTVRMSTFVELNYVRYEGVYVLAEERDLVDADMRLYTEQYSGYFTVSNCVQNEDGSVGRCTMTDRYEKV